MSPVDSLLPPSASNPVRGVFFSPRAWFSNLPAGSAADAVSLALVANMVSMAASIWLARALDPSVHASVGLGCARTAVGTLVVIYTSATCVYLLSRANTHEPFSKIVRCLAYAQIPMLVAVKPITGPFLPDAWCFVLGVLSLRYALHRSWRFATLCNAVSWVIVILGNAAVWVWLSE